MCSICVLTCFIYVFMYVICVCVCNCVRSYVFCMRFQDPESCVFVNTRRGAFVKTGHCTNNKQNDIVHVRSTLFRRDCDEFSE